MSFQPTKLPSTKVPPGTLSRDDVAKEVPELLPLYDEFPHIIYTKSDPVFETISPAFNMSISTQPLVIIRPLEESHVQAAVKTARAAGIPMGIRSGGSEMSARNYKGVDKGIIIDMRSMCSVEVSDDKASATIGGGTIGVDHVLGARLVLADGSVVDVDKNNNPDLFWALRGAGNGIWGVVTQLIIKIYPAPRLLIGSLEIQKEHWPAVLDRWANEIEPNLPQELAGDLYFRNPKLNKPEMIIFFAWCAKEGEDLKKGWEYFDMIKSLPGATVQRIAESDFASYILSELTIQPASFQTRGVIAKGMTKKIADVITSSWKGADIYMGIPCHFIHGMATKPDSSACFPLRYRHRIFPISARHGELPRGPEKDALVAEMCARVTDELKATGDAYVGAAYQNLLPPIDTDLEVTFGKETLEKLRALKEKYDPDNFFSRGYPVLVA